MSRGMNVGTISFYHPHLGGSGIMASRIAKELAIEGNTSRVISYGDSKNPKHMKNTGVILHPAAQMEGGFGFFKSEPHIETLISKSLEVIQEHGLDVVHSHYATPHAVVGTWLGMMTGTPHVATIHGSDIHTIGDHPGLKPVLEWALKGADHVTFVSDYLRRKCVDIYGTDFDGEVVPNFVDTNTFRKSNGNHIREELDIPEDAVVVTHASNFRPVKDTFHIGWAARKLLQEENLKEKLYFLLIGDSNAQDYLRIKQDITYAGFQDSFRFLGPQDSVAPYLAESDIALMTSHREGCPLFVLEALASSVPVVGSNIGGISGIVNHGETGLLFEVSNTNELVDSLRTLIYDSEQRVAMGRQGLETVLENYSRDVIIGRYQEIYQSVKRA